VWFDAGGISQHQSLRSRLDRVASKIVGSKLTPVTAIYNDRSKKELAILSLTKLICSNYCRQTGVLHHQYEKQNCFRNSFHCEMLAYHNNFKYSFSMAF